MISSDSADRAEEFERVLYQIGNNGLHAPIYRAALEHSGIVELHDAVLHHLLLGMLSRGDYEDEFAFNEGEWMRSLGSRLGNSGRLPHRTSASSATRCCVESWSRPRG